MLTKSIMTVTGVTGVVVNAVEALECRYREMEDEWSEKGMYDHRPSTFLTWIFTVLPERDPTSSSVLREVARRHRINCSDLLSIARCFPEDDAEKVLQCVSLMYDCDDEFWRCVNASSYDLVHTLCELYTVENHGVSALAALLSDPRMDLYKRVPLDYADKPLLHLLFARCACGTLRASLTYDEEDPVRRSVAQQYKRVLRTVLARKDFDPDFEDGGRPSLTAPQVYVDTTGCDREQALELVCAFAHSGADV